jgi:translation initiation factor 1
MSKKNDWKTRSGIVYSTDTGFQYKQEVREEDATRPNAQQNLRVMLDKSGRAGKQVTLITGFIGTQTDLESLTKLLKTKCGVGGSCKQGEILIQGDARKKVTEILLKEGFRAKSS